MIDIHNLRANGMSLSVRTWRCEAPTQPPVALLAGTGSTASDWDTVAADLSRDRVVHAIDLRGHGLSGWPGTYSIELMARDVAELLPQLADELDVIGHSLGGLVACKAAAGDNLIHRLVLEDVGVPHQRLPSPPTRPAGELDFDWAVVERVRPEIDDPDPTWPATLARSNVPTLAISGGMTSFVPAETVCELVDFVAHGSGTTIEAGHLVHASKPDDFIRVTRAHLDAANS